MSARSTLKWTRHSRKPQYQRRRAAGLHVQRLMDEAKKAGCREQRPRAAFQRGVEQAKGIGRQRSLPEQQRPAAPLGSGPRWAGLRGPARAPAGTTSARVRRGKSPVVS